MGFPSLTLLFSLSLTHTCIQLDKADAESEIDTLLENPAYIAILNNSRWSIIDAVDMSNKDALSQLLIAEEVIVRREANLKAFCRGLNVVGFADLIEKWPNLMRPLLVTEDFEITSTIFKGLIKSQKPSSPAESRAYDMFMNFISSIEGIS